MFKADLLFHQKDLFTFFAKDFATFAVNKKEKSAQLLTSSK